MSTNDLDAPLGLGPRQKRRNRLAITVPHAIAGVLGLSAAAFTGWAMLTEDPFGGEPIAVVPVAMRADDADAKSNPSGASATTPGGSDRPAGPDGGQGPASGAPPGTRTVTIIDGTSGRRQVVPIPGAPPDGKPPAPNANSPAPNDMPTTSPATSPAVDERLSESSRHGPLPKIAPDGTRPAEAFARAVKPLPGKPNAPRVAIVVGGLGISGAATGEALRKLPDAVTLAFSPYGGDLERQVGRAREAMREVLLQAPMEPNDYPDNDPGPQALLTSLDAAQNVDRLHWLMSRFQGYVGIVNAMGTRFTVSEQALAPILRETAKRGLIYLDDGSSPRSLAGQIAGANNLAFAKADLLIDSVPTSADIDRALARLESLARERSTAVGIATALPVSIDRIAKWAKAAEGRGLLLVPITAVVARDKSS